MTVKVPSPEDIGRLPKWAQKHIHDLSRALKTAEKSLHKYVDDQTPSPFQMKEIICLSETTTISKYVQGDTMRVVSGNVHMDVYPVDNGIDIIFEEDVKEAGYDVVLIPRASNSLQLRRAKLKGT